MFSVGLNHCLRPFYRTFTGPGAAGSIVTWSERPLTLTIAYDQLSHIPSPYQLPLTDLPVMLSDTTLSQLKNVSDLSIILDVARSILGGRPASEKHEVVLPETTPSAVDDDNIKEKALHRTGHILCTLFSIVCHVGAVFSMRIHLPHRHNRRPETARVAAFLHTIAFVSLSGSSPPLPPTSPIIISYG